jgi:branched-chain amino acid transport system substrate-binding protein
VQYLNNVSISVSAVLEPAGLDKSVGLISVAYYKDPTDPKWKDDPAFKEWLAWMQKYNPDGNVGDSFNVYGYLVAQTMEQVLKQCGNDLSRENIMHEAANLKNLSLPMLLPGIAINTGPDDFAPIKQVQLERFNGTIWETFGDVLTG